MSERRVFFGVALTSLAVLMLELALTRLFSATMYYHFAFLAISLALFGSGAGGIAVFLARRRLATDDPAGWLTGATIAFALGIVAALFVTLAYPLGMQVDRENLLRLTRIYVVTALPFFFAGSAIALAVARYARRMSTLYLFDLAGAAAGCILLIPVLNRLGAVNTVLAIAALAALAALAFASAGSGRWPRWLAGLVTVALLALLAHNAATERIDLREAKGSVQTHLLFSKWNSFSRVTVQGDLEQPVLRIKIDSDAATDIYRDGSNNVYYRDVMKSITAPAYHLKQGGDVLIIGPGGGFDVITARVAGMRSITAVEVNPIIARDVMSSEPFLDYSGRLFEQSDVRLVVDEGRSFIRSSRETYDIIQGTMVDTWAATAAGAFALTENYLYTVEAFKDYVEHLNDDGVLTMTRWYFKPPDQLLRMVSLTRAMMDELGIDNPSRHLMLVLASRQDRERVAATYLFKKSEFTDEEVRRIEALAESRGFGLLYTPLTRPDNVFRELIEADDPAQIWARYESNIAPTRDNNPFFFNALRPSHLGRVLEGSTEWKKTNLGTVVLFVLLVLTVAMVALFVLLPLAWGGRGALATRTREKLAGVAYFGCLGLGFILVEIMLIQKFILYLGHPVYALAVVLLAVLAFGALGSHLSGRVDEDRRRAALTRLLPALAGLVLVYVLVLSPVFYATVHLSHPLRILIALVLIAPLATLMGMPMPLGVRLLHDRLPEVVPWAWGVNGATSVLGSVAALVIALLTGFNQALLIGAATYLLARLLVPRGA